MSPFPRIPRVTTPSKFCWRIRRIPSRQYAFTAAALRTKLHSPVPPYAVVFRFHSSMPRIIGASCEVPITTPYRVAVA